MQRSLNLLLCAMSFYTFTTVTHALQVATGISRRRFVATRLLPPQPPTCGHSKAFPLHCVLLTTCWSARARARKKSTAEGTGEGGCSWRRQELRCEFSRVCHHCLAHSILSRLKPSGAVENSNLEAPNRALSSVSNGPINAARRQWSSRDGDGDGDNTSMPTTGWRASAATATATRLVRVARAIGWKTAEE